MCRRVLSRTSARTRPDPLVDLRVPLEQGERDAVRDRVALVDEQRPGLLYLLDRANRASDPNPSAWPHIRTLCTILTGPSGGCGADANGFGSAPMPPLCAATKKWSFVTSRRFSGWSMARHRRRLGAAGRDLRRITGPTAASASPSPCARCTVDPGQRRRQTTPLQRRLRLRHPRRGRIVRRGDDVTGLRPHESPGLGMAAPCRVRPVRPGHRARERHGRGGPTRRTGFLGSLLALPRRPRGASLHHRARPVLATVGVEEYADRYPPSLPYAVRKRVALARRWPRSQCLLLLTARQPACRPRRCTKLGELVRSLTERMSVILVEHHMDLVMKVCDEITVLDFGRVIAEGSPDASATTPPSLAAYPSATSGWLRHSCSTCVEPITSYGPVRAWRTSP